MNLIELRTDPSKKELAWFGVLLLAFVTLVAVAAWWATGTLTLARYVWTAGALLAGIYYAVPGLRRPIFVGWMYAAYPFGWLMSHALLAAIYFAMLTPIGLLMRAVGYDAMNRRIDRQAPSYWTARDRNVPAGRYFRQF
jgi:hypothetical protein